MLQCYEHVVFGLLMRMIDFVYSCKIIDFAY